MRNLRYFLVTIILVFLSISRVEAACTYGNESLNFTCSVNGVRVVCIAGGSGAKNVNLKDYSKVNAKETTKCTKLKVGRLVSNNIQNPTTSMQNQDVYLYSPDAKAPSVIGGYNVVYIELSPMTSKVVSPEEQAQKTLSNYNGKTCVYGSGVFKYVCTIKNGRPSCSLGCAEGSPCRDSYNWNDTTLEHTLKASDFLKGDNFVCPTNSESKLGMCGIVDKVNYYTSNVTIKSVGLGCSNYQPLPYPLNYAPNGT
ncbi:MAG: hypothetical protein K2J20_00150, partial [Bacilli bacterium]|nr:hypothetical protein [Bacilli bacterium]